jgi:hypothetical protein
MWAIIITGFGQFETAAFSRWIMANRYVSHDTESCVYCAIRTLLSHHTTIEVDFLIGRKLKFNQSDYATDDVYGRLDVLYSLPIVSRQLHRFLHKRQLLLSIAQTLLAREQWFLQTLRTDPSTN